MRIYIDCTDTYHSDLNTGIQRVVRNLVNHSKEAGNALGVECIPVMIVGDGYVPVQQLQYDFKKRSAFRLRARLNDYYLQTMRAIAKRSPSAAFNRFILASKHEFGLTRLVVQTLWPLSRMLRWRQRSPATEIRLRPGQGDVLLLVDSLWNYNFLDTANIAKRDGAKVIALIYDIIPISHPQLVDARNRINFEACFPTLYSCADGYLCISDYTRKTLVDYFRSQPYCTGLDAKGFDFFHLGAELDAIDAKGAVRTGFRETFESDSLAYLMVGTIEPRKNHVYLLRVFEQLWAEGSKASLVIVGRIGWLCDDVVTAIRTHPQFGNRLFFFSDASDAELDYCYAHADALLFPAIIEGFGLPLIEAQKKGLPVFASDIPVFREVAGDSVAYFDHSDPATLALMLQEHERTGIFPAKGPAGFTWPDWAASTSQMLTRLLRMTA
ncbi:MAG: glycosyltransferase family 1 protein [Pseudomonadota bacterium]